MPPTLTLPQLAAPAAAIPETTRRAGWLLPASLLFSLLLLGRWSQLPAPAARRGPVARATPGNLARPVPPATVADAL